MNRRDFLKAMLIAGAAPAIVKAENIMKIFVPPTKILTLYGDGIHDDTEALQAALNGEYVTDPNGLVIGPQTIHKGNFIISDTINLQRNSSITNSIIKGSIDGPLILAQFDYGDYPGLTRNVLTTVT